MTAITKKNPEPQTTTAEATATAVTRKADAEATAVTIKNHGPARVAEAKIRTAHNAKDL